MTSKEYLEKVKKFKFTGKHSAQIFTLPLILVGVVDGRLSLQEARVMDVYEKDIVNALNLKEEDISDEFYNGIIEDLGTSPFSHVDEVCEMVNYQTGLIDDEKKTRIKTILASGMYMIASASKDKSTDKSYISDEEREMIKKLVMALKLNDLEYGKKLLAL